MVVLESKTEGVLVVDDDQSIIDTFSRSLTRAGYRAIGALSGEEALAKLATESVSVILSDLAMPGMTGLEFMRRVRDRDPDLPILVVTGAPAMGSAIESIDAGVFRYITKPVSVHDIVRAVSDATHSRALARARREAFDTLAADETVNAAVFERALESVYMVTQPIVHAREQRVFAYEALLRTRDDTLRDPGSLLSAAEALGRVRALGRRVRSHTATLAESVPEGTFLFLNLHPHELLDPLLYAPTSPWTEHAERIVLELTERASLDGIPDARARVASLRDRGFRIALDDMGAGYAGLNSFALLEPQFVKIDLVLVRDVDTQPLKRRLIRTIVDLARDLDIQVVAEGVETEAERDALLALGCELLQGHLFARPGAPFPTVSWR